MERKESSGRLFIEVHSAAEVEEPAEEVILGLPTVEGAVLGSDHGDVVAFDLANPFSQGFSGGHVAAVEALDVGTVLLEVIDEEGAVGAFGGADVAGEEDLRDGIMDIDLAGGMEEVGREDLEDEAGSHFDPGALVGDGDEVIGAGEVHMGEETGPEAGDVDSGSGDLHPDIEAGADVGILVGEEDGTDGGEIGPFGETGGEDGKEAGSAGIEEDGLSVAGDEILVGGNPFLTGGLPEPQEKVPVTALLEQKLGHESS
jgi:hypothetical protein